MTNFDMILHGVFSNLIDEIDCEKNIVLNYLVSNRTDNLIPLTVQKVADGSKVSYDVALATIQALEKAGAIKIEKDKMYIDESLTIERRHKKNLMDFYSQKK